jgi:hypothetical protein
MDDENGLGGSRDRTPAPALGLDIGVTEILRDDAVWKQPPAWLEAKVTEQLRAPAALRSTTVVPLRSRFSGAGRGVRLVAAAAALVATAGAVTAVLAGSSGAEMTMAGTDLAQDASAKAVVKETVSGVEFTLDVEGLPPAPADSYYQGWVKGRKGLVSIGTFHLRSGSKDVVLWSGVSATDYPELTVTLQRAGGGPASSGRVVLTGDIPDLSS